MARIAITKIEGQGFRSLVKPFTFKLPKGNGFYFLTGSNKVNTDLGANGAGKSTLWDLVVYTFFGRSARGLKGPDLKSWHSSDLMATSVFFNVGEVPHVLIRTWNPNSLSLQIGTADPQKVEQSDIDQLLGCDYDLFLHVVLQGQFNPFFIDLQPTDKLKVWSKIMDLDEWLVRSKRAKDKHDEEKEALATAENSKAKVTGIIETLRLSLKNQKALLKEETKSKEIEIENNLVEIKRSQKIVDKCVAGLKAIKRGQSKVDAAQEAIKEREFVLCEKIRKRDSQRQQVEKAIAVLEAKQARLNKELKKFTEGVVCPWCLQDISPGHKKKMIKALTSDIRDVKRSLKEEFEEVNDLTERLESLGNKLSGIKDKLEESRQVDYSLLSKKTAILKDEENNLYRITQLEKANKKLEESSNVMPEIARLRVQLKEAKEKRNACKISVKDSEAKLVSYKLWIQAFKDIRLWLVNKALAELEMHVNNSFVELGLKGWTIEFTVQHENKSGGISKGLTAKIRSPQQDRLVPWHVWSGGETQRIRIATAVGLQRLIQSRTSFSCNLEVWDEPTEHMSKEGIEDLLNFFEMRQQEDKKQVWLVDHKSLEFGGFSGSAVLTRTPTDLLVKYEY